MGTQQQMDIEKTQESDEASGVQQPQQQSRTLVWVLLVCSAAFLVATATLGILYGQQVANYNNNLCQSTGCIKAANRILGSMNTSVDPCEDFYQYSCGQWIDDHIISESQSSITLFGDLYNSLLRAVKIILEKPIKADEAESIIKAKQFYKSCMDTDEIERLGLSPAWEMIQRMGGWPILGVAQLNTNTSLEEKLAIFNTVHGTPAIIQPSVDADSKSSMDRIIQIHEPSLVLQRRYYLEDENINKTKAYKQYIVNFLTALSNETTSNTTEEFKMFAEQVVDFETRIANNTVSRDDYKEDLFTYPRRTLKNITSDVNPNFNWVTYIRKVMEIAEDSTIVVDEDTEIMINAIQYATNFTDILRDYDDTFLHNYLVLTVMDAKTFFLPQHVRDTGKDLTKELYGTTKEEERWKQCSAVTKLFFPMPVGSLFVQDHFPPENKAATEVMVEQIRTAFKANLDDIDWMDAETKAKAREKADMISEMIAYPDYIINDQALMDRHYGNCSIAADTFLQNDANINAHSVKLIFGALNKKVDREAWILGPAVVNAFYSPSRNQIFFPAGILQPPFYDQYQPTAMNYGGIGMVIGHEITHGFDDSGANYNGEGNLVNWWTEYSKSGFDKKSKCLSDQYSRESWRVAGDTNIDGKQTLGENIADNGGIRESFLAFREWQASGDGGKDVRLPGLQDFTDEQLFFLGFAQVWCGKFTKTSAKSQLKVNSHSPGEFRVKVPGMNYEEFGKAYNCRKGVDNMYPSSGTCRVW